MNVPSIVFIVPYRNRCEQSFFYKKHMSFILEDVAKYEIYFSHQCDSRTFNRGATRNIGFLSIMEKYPDHYKDITFVFNDVDTVPFNKILAFETTKGIVKHFYGYDYALGGIVSIKGSDFEKINGYPCYWGWGREDTNLQNRCHNNGIIIDRTNFFKIGSPKILQLFDGISRIISKQNDEVMLHDTGIDGLKTIQELKYNIKDKSENDSDNIYEFVDDRIFYINIKSFKTYIDYKNEIFFSYDLREPKRCIIKPADSSRITNPVITNKEWTNIPYFPTSLEQCEKIICDYNKQGKQIPLKLVEQYKKYKSQTAIKDPYEIPSSKHTVQNTISSRPKTQFLPRNTNQVDVSQQKWKGKLRNSLFF